MIPPAPAARRVHATPASPASGDDLPGLARDATAALLDASSPLAGTGVGSCIAAAMQGLSVPPYDGDPVTVRRWISIR
jgi:hypothetical protein